MSLLNAERAATPTALRIRAATPQDAAKMAQALAAAFYGDPVFRHFSPDDERRAAMLPALFDVFVEAYLGHGETYAHAGGAGAALWAYPGQDPLSADAAYGERLEEIAGIDAPRLFEIVEALESQAPTEPHYHLQFLGVRPERQGEGLGGTLMTPILRRCDQDGIPAYLEATSDRNRALYERHGFRARGAIPLPDGPALWRMWRDPVA
jgi:GNAT superfamily N-acetyltransferase